MTKSKMISAYTPSNTAPEVLERIFVQRRRLLNHIVSRLSASMYSGDKHHILLVGPRGSGKTHLVSMAVWELKKTPELSDSMRIAWLGEDDVFSGLIHLAFAIAKALADEYPDEFPADFKSGVRGLPPDDAALAILHSVLKNLHQRHLLIVTENLDQTFSSLGETGQKKLRAFLQETRRIATLTTSQQLFAGVSSRKEAFFGFFDTHHLDPLAVDDAQQLIRNIAAEQLKPDLAEYLTSTSSRYRIRALHHLAGGNYRMYVLLSEFLTKDQLDDLVSSFETLADALTPYFQERMRSLPDQQRQILQWLCDAEGARTVKEIAEETFISERNCSKQLGNLKSNGYVRSERRGKESYYDVAEPLMRLCLDIKSQRGRPLKLVARFLKAWFPEETLKALANHDDVDPTLAVCSLEQMVERLRRAFEEGQKNLASYGGAPFDLVALILERGPSEWAQYASAIAAIYIQYNAAAKLGQGITKSIELLDQGDFSPSQLDQWYRAWQQASDGCEDLQLPLECLAAAVDVLKSDTPDDRPLFRLPLEIRQLVQPLLRRTLTSE